MAVIIPDRRVIVTAAPGTGSTSLMAAALGVPGSAVVEPGPEVDLDAKHALVGELVEHGCLPPDHGCCIVTSVRNPFAYWHAEWRRSRLRWRAELDDPTSWVHRRAGLVEQIETAAALDFGAWLRHVARRWGAPQHVNAGHVDEADVVLRTERLEGDVRWHLGPWFPPVPRLNVTGPGGRAYRTHYGPDDRRLVADHHAPTLRRFGYTF